MHAYRQQHKQKKSTNTKWGQNPNNQARRSPAALSEPARDADTSATRGRGRRAVWQRCNRVGAERAALRRCSRIRGLPDADDTPLHATDHARHAPTPRE